MTADSSERQFHGVAIYNPDLLSRDELIAQFVARTGLLNQFTADLRQPKFGQHRVIVGTRGMGKTTLLRRIRFAVEQDSELSQIWMPVTFPEEQYNVGRLSDFYVNVIDALGDALEQTGRREDAATIDDAVENLPRNDTARAETALGVLLQAAEHIGRRLILLVDNLDLVIERLETSEQWALREILSHEPRILLIGAMPVIIGATYEYKAPFFEFFHIHELKGLTRDETREVLLTLSRQQNAPGVEALIRNDPARIDTLHTLTGGNPRTIALLFSVLAQGTEGDARSDLEKLLDQSTPLYKSRFEALPPQAQQVVDAVAIHWDPISAGELAEQLGMDVNQVSAQLNRLVQQSVIEKVEYHPSTKTGFQVAERFFNIWYLMRASRRVRRRLLWLVQFLRLFYGAETLKSKAHDLLTAASTSGTDLLRHAEFCLAIAELIEDDRPTRSALESHAIRTLLGDAALSQELEVMLDLNGADASLKDVVDREKWVALFNGEVDRLLVGAKQKEKIKDLIGGSGGLTREQKVVFVQKIAEMKDADRRSTLKIFSNSRDAMAYLYGPALTAWLVRAFRDGLMNGVDDESGAHAAAIVFGKPQIDAVFAFGKTDAIERLQQLSRLGGDPFVLASLASKLFDENRLDEAAKAIRSVPSAQRFVFADLVHGLVAARLGSFDEAIGAFQNAVSRYDTNPVLWRELAKALLNVDRIEEAFQAFERSLSIERAAETLSDYGRALAQSDRDTTAEGVLREALTMEPANEKATGSLMLLLVRSGRLEEANHIADSVIDAASEPLQLQQATVYLNSGRREDGLRIMRRVMSNKGLPVSLTIRAMAVLFLLDASEDGLVALRHVIARWSSEPTPSDTALLIEALHAVVLAGSASTAAALIDENGAAQQFRPIFEALRIAGTRDRGLLKRLSPELQQPVEQILDSWSDTSWKATKKKTRQISRER